MNCQEPANVLFADKYLLLIQKHWACGLGFFFFLINIKTKLNKGVEILQM